MSKEQRERWYSAIQGAIATMVLMLIVIAILYWLNPPSLRYSNDIYAPVDAVLCPGEMLDATTGIEVRRAKVSALLVRVWWSVDRREAVYNEPARWSVFMEPMPMMPHTLAITVPQLPPGRYEFREAREQFRNMEAPSYRVPFVVPEGCS